MAELTETAELQSERWGGPITYGRCEYCEEQPGNPCVSSGGYTFQAAAHAPRRTLLRKEKGRRRAAGLPPLGVSEISGASAARPTDRLRIALWYIDQAGGPEEAQALLTAACAALQAGNVTG